MKVISGIFLAAMCTSWTLAQSQDKEGFTLVKKEGNISVYERWLMYQSQPPVKSRELKTEFFYNNSIYAGLRLIRNEGKAIDWQSHVSEFKIYPQRDTATWYEYSYHDIPWPVSDQDHFMEYKASLKHPGMIIISFKSKVNNTLAPERKNATRMILSGSWTLEQVNPQKVKATYRVFSKPLDIPRVFTDPIIRGSMVTSMEEFVTIVEGKGAY